MAGAEGLDWVVRRIDGAKTGLRWAAVITACMCSVMLMVLWKRLDIDLGLIVLRHPRSEETRLLKCALEGRAWRDTVPEGASVSTPALLPRARELCKRRGLAGSPDAEATGTLQKALEMVTNDWIEQATVRAPFFGFVIDVDDLVLIGGLGLVVGMLLVCRGQEGVATAILEARKIVDSLPSIAPERANLSCYVQGESQDAIACGKAGLLTRSGGVLISHASCMFGWVPAAIFAGVLLQTATAEGDQWLVSPTLVVVQGFVGGTWLLCLVVLAHRSAETARLMRRRD